MNGKAILYIDQYGSKFWSTTVAELREKIGGGRVSKMYRDKKDGSTVHVGYVIGQYWLNAYQPCEIPA